MLMVRTGLGVLGLEFVAPDPWVFPSPISILEDGPLALAVIVPDSELRLVVILCEDGREKLCDLAASFERLEVCDRLRIEEDSVDLLVDVDMSGGGVGVFKFGFDGGDC